jgi:hypothetical protein
MCHCLMGEPPKTEFQNLACVIGQWKLSDPPKVSPKQIKVVEVRGERFDPLHQEAGLVARRKP